MEIVNDKQTLCQKHHKSLEIFVVHEAKYICEDCAIFQPLYKNQILMEKQTVTIKANQIDNQCKKLTLIEQSNKDVTHKNLNALFKQIDIIQSQLMDDIKNQFKEIRSKVQTLYLDQVEIKQRERNKHGRPIVEQILNEKIPQQKVKKEKQYHSNIDTYKNYLDTQTSKINAVFQNILNSLSTCKMTNIIDIAQQFANVFVKQTNNKDQLNEDLLDFSEFSIIEENQEPEFIINNEPILPNEAILIQDPNLTFQKRHHVERMKTAPCLQDSLCSIQSFAKSIQSKCLNIPIAQNLHLQQSIISERSITCSSVASKTLTCSRIMTKESSKKFTIEVTSTQQLKTKLLTISPTTKIIRLKNFMISSQDFSSLLKQKISKSFIHTLEIINCPKLSDKILMDLKSFRCKSLKKIEIKECREINWADKKVKDVVRKLQTEGVKIIC